MSRHFTKIYFLALILLTITILGCSPLASDKADVDANAEDSSSTALTIQPSTQPTEQNTAQSDAQTSVQNTVALGTESPMQEPKYPIVSENGSWTMTEKEVTILTEDGLADWFNEYPYTGNTLTFRFSGDIKDVHCDYEHPRHEDWVFVDAVILEEGITSIEYFCWEMRPHTLYIPSTLQTIEAGALWRYTTVSIAKENRYFHSADGILYETKSMTAIHCDKTISHATLQKGTKRIENYAFRDTESLETLAFSGTEESIGEHAFENCGIKELNLPDSIRSIEESAFTFCRNLKVFRIPPNADLNLNIYEASLLYGSSVEGIIISGRNAKFHTNIVYELITKVMNNGGTLKWIYFECEPPEWSISEEQRLHYEQVGLTWHCHESVANAWENATGAWKSIEMIPLSEPPVVP